MIRAVDLAEVGAGGGSIIHINMGGSLTIGPQSAGSNPGPICYGLGGSDPTITDANLLLGYLNPRALAGSSVSVDYEKPAFIFDKDIASPLKLNILEAAYGAHTIANSTMSHAIDRTRSRHPKLLTTRVWRIRACTRCSVGQITRYK